MKSDEDLNKARGEVFTLFDDYKAAGQTAFEKVLEMGDRLYSIRTFLGTGKNSKWNKEFEAKTFPFQRAQANRYIRIWLAHQEDKLQFEGDENKFSVRAGLDLIQGTNDDDGSRGTTVKKLTGVIAVSPSTETENPKKSKASPSLVVSLACSENAPITLKLAAAAHSASITANQVRFAFLIRMKFPLLVLAGICQNKSISLNSDLWNGSDYNTAFRARQLRFGRSIDPLS